MPEPPCIIASNRPWNRTLAARLTQRCGIPFHQITERAELTEARLQALAPRFVFFPHWSYKIPEPVFRQFPCIIFHMTDLPYGRGGSPLQNLIARGHSETMMSALRCVAAFDAGPIYMKRPLSLHGTAEEIYLRADRLIEDMITEILKTDPEPVPQEGEPVVFGRRRPEDGTLSEVTDLDTLYDRIRMLDAQGYPPAFLDAGPFRLTFSRATRRCESVVADIQITLREETSDE